ncbi:hypothetical protein [Mucilaginibacter sp.]|uniref:hypothetical protein n=1 Tax=Mucilaginibacter sp. TaxID=1882438 RepID=UPI003B0006D1
MDIQTEKIKLAKLLLSTDKEHVIQSVKQIFERERQDFWNDLSTDQQEEIDKADLEIEKGETVDYEILMAKHRL